MHGGRHRYNSNAGHNDSKLKLDPPVDHAPQISAQHQDDNGTISVSGPDRALNSQGDVEMIVSPNATLNKLRSIAPGDMLYE